MITVEGKEVFTELSELVDPAHTALLVIDMQRDFVDPEGAFGLLGVDLSMYRESLPMLAGLLQRRAPCPSPRDSRAEHDAAGADQRFACADPLQPSHARRDASGWRAAAVLRRRNPRARVRAGACPRCRRARGEEAPVQRILGNQSRAAVAQQRHQDRGDRRLHDGGMRGVRRLATRCSTTSTS